MMSCVDIYIAMIDTWNGNSAGYLRPVCLSMDTQHLCIHRI